MILLVDYEPRTAARVTEALAPLEIEVVAAKDIDAAVSACAKREPRLVLISSVLPHMKVADAITQLRARAGLRNTPFVILMSGYTGKDPVNDAVDYGAQEIVAKPFSNDDLLSRVSELLETPKAHATLGQDTRSGVMEALRRSAGLEPTQGTMTSEDLFGDLIGEEDEEEVSPAVTQRIAVEAVFKPEPPATAPKQPRRDEEAAASGKTVRESLDDVLVKPKAAPTRREDTGGASVDELLSQTLSGLEVKIPKKQRPAPTPPAPEVSEPPKPPEPAQPEAPLPGGAPFGQYRLMDVIATGGMAEVYKARMQGVEGFQKIVAIKRILPHLTDNDEFVTMFIDEAKLAAQLQHPNIIHIYDLGKIDKSYYIAMEYIDGKDLRSILRKLEEEGRHMPFPLAVYIASRLAAALDYAHRKRDLQGSAMALVHRDVSPQNVLISYDGDIKLCDFGIAKAASKASHTRAGALKGKLQYMSPEQAWGKDLDHRSDIFSLGLVLYEMVTGRKAFAGDSELSILEQVRSPRLVQPREIEASIPEELQRVAMKALQEDRDKRYQKASEMAADLEAILRTLRPAPGAAELGSFLAELEGREKAASAPAAPVEEKREKRAPAPKPAAPPAPREAPVKPAPVPPPVVEAPPKAPAELPPPRRFPVGIAAAAALVVVAAVAGYLLLGRTGGSGTTEGTAAATPSAETMDLARQMAQQEVARQEPAMRERLAQEMLTPTPEGSVQAPAAAPTAPAAAATPRPTSAAVVAPPTAVPTAVPTAAPTPVETAPAVVPTAVPPTPLPTARPTAAPTRPPIASEQPVVHEGDLVDLTSDVIPPEPITTPKATYPPLARQRRVGGIVILRALVNENGTVDDVQVLRGIRPDLGLDSAAATAVKSWRFKPATKNGVRVKVWYTVSIPFQP